LIFIADSTASPYSFEKPLEGNVHYFHIPSVTYTQKIEYILGKITTDYVAICADDDFLVPEGLLESASFLESNKDYSAAHGTIVRYYKQQTYSNNIRFEYMYEGDYTLDQSDPFERLKKMFNPYKTLFSAVHRTEILRQSFKNAGKSITNLYLNEYLTAIGPVLLGKTKDLPCLYQVREHADASDDKKIKNIDVVLYDDAYRKEAESFLDIIINAGMNCGLEEAWLKQGVREALFAYAQKLKELRTIEPTFRKKIGRIVEMIPVVGPLYVEKNRYKISRRKLTAGLSQKEMTELDKISSVIKKYAH
jgi:glycosyltransferase domain-containing protein